MKRSWLDSQRLRKCVFYGVAPLLFAAGACDKVEEPPKPDELQALLDDGELDEAMTAAALTVEKPAAVLALAGAGGTPIPAPMGGTAGMGSTGGVGGVSAADAGVASDGPRVPFDGGFDPGCIPDPGMGGGRDAGKGGPVGMGGSPGMGGSGGGGGGLPFCNPNPLARWEMDDCNPDRTELGEFFNGFTAFRSVNVRCVEGAEGQGVSLPNAKDLVYVPDQPRFTFERGVTVAAWLKPSRITGTATIFRKREGTTSSLALMVSGGRYTFVIDRANGLPAAVSAPATLNTWTHVAATYDGAVLRLYINGKVAQSLKAAGMIEGGEGPLLVGNDANHRRFEGAIDKVSFDVRPASAETIFAMQCLHKVPSLTASPLVASVPIGTPATFNFTLKNENAAACGPDTLFIQQQFFEPGFDVAGGFTEVFLASGESRVVPVTITPNDEADTGTFSFDFTAGSFSTFLPDPPRVTVKLTVTAGGCRVSTRRELMIRDVSVVDDPIRTDFTAPASDPRRGVWTFKHLMEQLAPSAAAAPDFVEGLLHTYTVEQTVNSFTIPTRPGMQRLLDAWPRVNGKLDLERAPFRLLAIVNRLDLRDLSEGHAGEGRFVFGFLGDGFPLEATMIFEFHQPAKTAEEIRAKVDAWHALGAKPFPSEEYNVALQALTEAFVKRGADSSKPNGSALAQLRTNEIALGDGAPWQMREFNFDAMGRLLPAAIKQTPDRETFDQSATLAKFINDNEAALLTETHVVPMSFEGAPFLSGAVFNDLEGWNAPGINNLEARHQFSKNTCNGCHSLTETNTFFLQVSPRFPGQQAQLSSFLTGTTTFDRFSGQVRFFNDLGRRNRDLLVLVCPADQIPPLPPPSTFPDGGFGGSGGSGGRVDAGSGKTPTMSVQSPTDGQPATSLTKGIKRPD